MEYALATGMVRARSSSVTACSETVRLSGIPSSANARICGTSPQVERLILRALMPIPSPSVTLRKNRTTFP